MKRHRSLLALLLAVPLIGTARVCSAQAISFSPGSGVVQPGQSVAVTATGDWPSPPTIFCTTDGSPANIAATLVGSAGSGGGSLSVLQGANQTSETLNCVAALGAVAYQNVNQSDSGWEVCIGNLTYASNGAPAATCSGGVGSSYPSYWDLEFGSTQTEEMTGGDDVQILFPFLAHVCPLCDQPPGTQIMMAQSKTVMATADSTILSNNEMDMQSVDATNTMGGVPVEHNFGLQCEQSAPASNPGFWAIDGVGKWVPTAFSDECPWPVNVPINVVAQGWWQLGDAGCGGNGCFHVMSFTVNGAVHDLSGTVWEPGLPPGTLAQPGQPRWSSFFGIQDQLDLTASGGDAGRTVSNANVTEAYYTPSPVTGSASYAAPAAATLISPAPGITLAGSSATFTWNPGSGVSQYLIHMGTTGAGSADVVNTGSLHTTSTTINGIPTAGFPLTVRLYSLINGTWQYNDYSYTEFNSTLPAVMSTPASGSTLTGSSATFTWSPGSGVTQYLLHVGTLGPGSSNIAHTSSQTSTSATITSIPTTGGTVNVRLYSFISGVWQYNDYSYAEATSTPAVLSTPAPGSMLTSSSATLTWTAGSGVTQYTVHVGTTGAGSTNVAAPGTLSTTSYTVSGIPTAGATLYVRLYSFIAGAWQYVDYTYVEASPAAQAAMSSPAASSTLTGSSANFVWTPGNQVTQYTIHVGTTGVGSTNICAPGSLATTNYTVSNIPTASGTLYVRLYSFIAGAWQYTDYTYTEASAGP